MESIPVLINSILNASSLEALKGQLVVALTQVYENGGGGGGITSITSTDNSITIDNTDPSAPDLSVGAIVSYFSVAGLTENGNGSIVSISNRIGGTISFVNAGSFSYTLTRTGGSPLTGTVRAFLSNLMENGSQTIANSATQGIDFNDTFDLLLYDGTALTTGQSVKNGLLTIIYVP